MYSFLPGRPRKQESRSKAIALFYPGVQSREQEQQQREPNRKESQFEIMVFELALLSAGDCLWDSLVSRCRTEPRNSQGKQMYASSCILLD